MIIQTHATVTLLREFTYLGDSIMIMSQTPLGLQLSVRRWPVLLVPSACHVPVCFSSGLLLNPGANWAGAVVVGIRLSLFVAAAVATDRVGMRCNVR